MLTDSSCTLYRFNKIGFDRYFIPECHWQECKSANVMKSGMQNADGITVYIPAEAAVLHPNGFVYHAGILFQDMDILPKNPAQDIIIKGECKFTFDNTSQQTASESLKKLREQYDFHTVMSIDRLLYGSPNLRHIKISAR